MKGEFSMRRILITLLASCLLASVSLSAATGQYVVVEVEAFESWGILHWGTWEPMEEALLSIRMHDATKDDEGAVAEILATCDTTSDAGIGVRGACTALDRFDHVRASAYDIDPLLGRPYRIQLRNLTAGYIGVVLSVDGLNTNGNAPVIGDATDRKWILRPGQTATISGWQVTADEALQFEFATPSLSHSSLESLRGTIALDVYLGNPFAEEDRRGTEAGEMIDQPTVVIPFVSATAYPVETMSFDYSRDRVVLGIQCEETNGAGIRIAAVVEGTAAQQAGLRTGDIITYANAIPINTCSDMQALLDSKSPGDRIVLKVHRPDRVFLVTVELEE
ncbi:MAG: PDZ domain-containing protein [Candidatus Atribacteria bacterium]|nr:MAG: PDZ domain-containing protein [Candidatus Atribacteria bacterium]